MLRAFMPALVSLAFCQAATANVSGTLTYSYYVATAKPGTAISAALNQASPFRQGGKVFHAYTKWYVNWHYHWNEQPDGSCRMDDVQVALDSTIHLPALVNESDEQHTRFMTYLLALRRHELGHVDFGKQAARAIDAGILSLPEMRSCAELESAGNRLGNRMLDQFRHQEFEYDVTTGHGKTQGARLDN